MRKYRTFAVLLVILSLLIPSVAYSLNHGLSAETGGEEGILVGRIAHVEGLVYRYIPEEGAWVQVAVDSPFGLEDKLRSDRRSRAEVILPNNTWFRMDGYTHLHLLSLHDEATEMHMVHGSARFMNKGSFPTIYVSTPFGEVSAPAQTSFDLHVSDSSMEAVALEGSVYFSRDGGRTKTEVTERSASLFADRYAVTAGERYRDSLWDAWNLERDALWAQRMRAGRVSAKYLPPALHDHGYALDDYGVWRRVHYEGVYGYLWRPLYVSPVWAPYTAGRWSLWYGDHVWISHEPFGYVTHHYGTWIYTGGYWYWAPPVASFSVQFVHPSLRIGPAWYPGRVAWFHVGTSIGWIPLAPHEPYYAYRRWGPRTVIVKNVTVVNVNVRSYRNERHAVMIDKRKFHTTDNYRTASIRTVDRRTLGAEIQAQPVVDQEQTARNTGRVGYAIRSGETGRTSQTGARMDSMNRQDVLPRRAGAQEAVGVTGARTSERKPDSPARSAPTPFTQQRNEIGRDAARDNSRSTALTHDKSPQRNITQPPAPARLRPGPERPAGESGTAFRSLSQQGRHGLEQASPEADRSPNARIQRQRAVPDKASPGSMENSAGRGPFDRSSRATGG
jgi:hypothetical protein